MWISFFVSIFYFCWCFWLACVFCWSELCLLSKMKNSKIKKKYNYIYIILILTNDNFIAIAINWNNLTHHGLMGCTLLYFAIFLLLYVYIFSFQFEASYCKRLAMILTMISSGSKWVFKSKKKKIILQGSLKMKWK